MSTTVVVVGDILLDRDISGTADRLAPDAPVPVLVETSSVERPGGAGLAAYFLAADGADVVLIGAIAHDEAGRRLRELLAAVGVTLIEIPYLGRTVEKIRLRAGPHALLRLDRGVEPGEFGALPDTVAGVLTSASAVLVSDYGRGVTSLPALRRALVQAAPRVPIVWDPHPRGSTPVPGTRLVCPNRAEAVTFASQHGVEVNGEPAAGAAAVAAEAGLLRGAWRVDAVVVTLGAQGALLAEHGSPVSLIPTPGRHGGDTCGAGDRFAAAATLALARGGEVRAAVTDAVAASSNYVAGDGPASLSPALSLEGTL